MESWARVASLILVLAVVVLHTRHVVRTARFRSQPRLRDCIWFPNLPVLLVGVVAGVFPLLLANERIYSNAPWPRWVVSLALLFCPGWTAWCLATLAILFITSWRWRRGDVFK